MRSSSTKFLRSDCTAEFLSLCVDPEKQYSTDSHPGGLPIGSHSVHNLVLASRLFSSTSMCVSQTLLSFERDAHHLTQSFLLLLPGKIVSMHPLPSASVQDLVDD
ncbi:hypothetical protein M758_1G333300 [Ceratodon purpureus]|nr:hypothetical protein M758_1G333300 [Ceratodon purpureus]